MGEIVSRLQILIDQFSNGKHTVFARTAGIPPSTFQSYLKGRMPHSDHLIRINETYGANLHWLLTGEGSMTGSADAIPQTEEEPADEIEVFFELNERVEGWIQKGLAKPQAKKELVRELYDLVSVRNKKGKGSRQEPQGFSVTNTSGVTTIGRNNKVTSK